MWLFLILKKNPIGYGIGGAAWIGLRSSVNLALPLSISSTIKKDQFPTLASLAKYSTSNTLDGNLPEPALCVALSLFSCILYHSPFINRLSL